MCLQWQLPSSVRSAWRSACTHLAPIQAEQQQHAADALRQRLGGAERAARRGDARLLRRSAGAVQLEADLAEAEDAARLRASAEWAQGFADAGGCGNGGGGGGLLAWSMRPEDGGSPPQCGRNHHVQEQQHVQPARGPGSTGALESQLAEARCASAALAAELLEAKRHHKALHEQTARLAAAAADAGRLAGENAELIRQLVEERRARHRQPATGGAYQQPRGRFDCKAAAASGARQHYDGELTDGGLKDGCVVDGDGFGLSDDPVALAAELAAAADAEAAQSPGPCDDSSSEDGGGSEGGGVSSKSSSSSSEARDSTSNGGEERQVEGCGASIQQRAPATAAGVSPPAGCRPTPYPVVRTGGGFGGVTAEQQKRQQRERRSEEAAQQQLSLLGKPAVPASDPSSSAGGQRPEWDGCTLVPQRQQQGRRASGGGRSGTLPAAARAGPRASAGGARPSSAPRRPRAGGAPGGRACPWAPADAAACLERWLLQQGLAASVGWPQVEALLAGLDAAFEAREAERLGAARAAHERRERALARRADARSSMPQVVAAAKIEELARQLAEARRALGPRDESRQRALVQVGGWRYFGAGGRGGLHCQASPQVGGPRMITLLLPQAHIILRRISRPLAILSTSLSLHLGRGARLPHQPGAGQRPRRGGRAEGAPGGGRGRARRGVWPRAARVPGGRRVARGAAGGRAGAGRGGRRRGGAAAGGVHVGLGRWVAWARGRGYRQ